MHKNINYHLPKGTQSECEAMVAESGQYISEKDSTEIRELIGSLKLRDLQGDRDILKMIEYCDHLLMHTMSMQSTLASMKSAYDFLKCELLSSSLTL